MILSLALALASAAWAGASPKTANVYGEIEVPIPDGFTAHPAQGGIELDNGPRKVVILHHMDPMIGAHELATSILARNRQDGKSCHIYGPNPTTLANRWRCVYFTIQCTDQTVESVATFAPKRGFVNAAVGTGMNLKELDVILGNAALSKTKSASDFIGFYTPDMKFEYPAPKGYGESQRTGQTVKLTSPAGGSIQWFVAPKNGAPPTAKDFAKGLLDGMRKKLGALSAGCTFSDPEAVQLKNGWPAYGFSAACTQGHSISDIVADPPGLGAYYFVVGSEPLKAMAVVIGWAKPTR